MTVVPCTRVGVTTSGKRPVLASSKTAIFPPGPLNGTATRSQLAVKIFIAVNKVGYLK